MKKPIFFLTAATLLSLGGLFFACGNKPNPVPPAENINLETAVWQLTDFLSGQDALAVPDTLPVPITVKFSAGKVEGFGGCNGIGGNYTAEGNSLTVSNLMSTKMFCEGISNLEQSFLQSLGQSQSYQIKEETLEINCGDMAGLRFRLNWKKR